MWVGIKNRNETQRLERKRISDSIPKYTEFILKYFKEEDATGIEFPETVLLFPIGIWVYIDLNTLNLPISCETCKMYVGIGRTQRMMFNIPIINSYCNEIGMTVKYSRIGCRIYRPTNFWRRVILQKIKTACDKHPTYSFNHYKWDVYQDFQDSEPRLLTFEEFLESEEEKERREKNPRNSIY